MNSAIRRRTEGNDATASESRFPAGRLQIVTLAEEIKKCNRNIFCEKRKEWQMEGRRDGGMDQCTL